MLMEETLLELFSDHTIRIVSAGSGIIGFTAGVLGCFAYLRKQSLMGDVVSHSSLSGITIAFIVGATLFAEVGRSMLTLLIGAAVFGTIATLFSELVTRRSKIKPDTAMAVSLALFFGGGLTLMRVIQGGPYEGKAGLSSYIFGRAAGMTQADLTVIIGFSVLALTVLIFYWKEFKIYTFDPSMAELLGFPRRYIEPLMLATVVVAIVIGLKAVGVILMIAFIVAPSSAARQWTGSLGGMVILSGVFGAFASIAGSLLSVVAGDYPTGPVIVLVLSAIVVVSLLFAPRRSLLLREMRIRQQRRALMRELAAEETQEKDGLA